MARALRWSRHWLPNGWGDALRQLLVFGIAYYAYRLVRGFVDGQVVTAFAHAREVISIERALHLFFEPAVQDWAQRTGWLIKVANFMYVNSQFVVTTTFIVWLYLARNRSFYYVRNMFAIAMGLALVGYIVFPTAPPRFMPEWGFEDTVSDFVGDAAASSATVLYNPFAAVPSMHVAFALMVGIPCAVLVRSRVLKALWALYPLIITFVVISTANHFWFDAAVGGLVAAVSAVTAHLALARIRPEAWSFRRKPVTAEAHS
ncbi:MAG: phosphatase PAP2 family protein [Thermoleophilaceae bacterium]|nr:phosphatase PAP2 family protein [Thermoleophilaceae bacterium]